MADMHWFRWHHGVVTDPKLGLIAKKALVSMAEVVAIWAFLLEEASVSEDRGNPGEPDFEAIDFALGLEEGAAQRVYGQMQERGLIEKESRRLVAWDRRQPKREREDDTSAERKRKQREREASGVTTGGETSHDEFGDVTPRHATSRQKTPRGEERREDKKIPPYPPQAGEVGGEEAETSRKSGAVCKAIRAKGVSDVNPSNPKLRALVGQGVPVDIFEQAAEICTKAIPPKGLGYLLGIVERQLREASGIRDGPAISEAAWDQSRTTIEAKAEELGIGKWNEADLSEGREQWPAYFARVRAAVERRATQA